MASEYENDHQYVSTGGKKPPKLASKDLSSDWTKIYGTVGSVPGMAFQDKAETSNGNWNSATHTAKSGKKPAGL